MIVITGTGRSGTSLVAQLYRELGFDPGGFWIPEYNAGYEAKDVVRQNALVIRDLRLTILANRTVNEAVRRLLNDPDDPPHGKLSWRLSNAIEWVALRCLGRRAEQLELVPWERFDEVVDTYRLDMIEISRRLQVAKDPFFCWTLGAWAAAGAQIDHVLVCVRHLDAVVESRMAAQQVVFKTRSEAKNSFIYGLGLCMAAIYSYRLPHALVRFPDFLDEPATLFEAMRFPTPVTFDRFLDAFSRIASAELIHDVR
jgi:hypothetical protein